MQSPQMAVWVHCLTMADPTEEDTFTVSPLFLDWPFFAISHSSLFLQTLKFAMEKVIYFQIQTHFICVILTLCHLSLINLCENLKHTQIMWFTVLILKRNIRARKRRLKQTFPDFGLDMQFDDNLVHLAETASLYKVHFKNF